MKLVPYLLVLIVGIALGFAVCLYSFFKEDIFRIFTSECLYVTLEKDVILQNESIIKKGTKVKFDAGMSEGFDRYILYINAKPKLEGQVGKFENMIIPYWVKK